MGLKQKQHSRCQSKSDMAWNGIPWCRPRVLSQDMLTLGGRLVVLSQQNCAQEGSRAEQEFVTAAQMGTKVHGQASACSGKASICVVHLCPEARQTPLQAEQVDGWRSSPETNQRMRVAVLKLQVCTCGPGRLPGVCIMQGAGLRPAWQHALCLNQYFKLHICCHDNERRR